MAELTEARAGVRAGMVKDPADYRWSSYEEAVGSGTKGSGRKARERLVRAYFSDQGAGFKIEKWPEISRLYRRLMGLSLGMTKMLHCRVHYFTDDAVIGSKEFVNEAFAIASKGFVATREDGARALKGNGDGANGRLWSSKDLRMGI